MENGIPIVCFQCGSTNIHDISLMPSIVRVKDTLQCSDCGCKFHKTSWAWDRGDREPGCAVKVVGFESNRLSGTPYTGTGIVVRRNHNCPHCEGESTRPNGTDNWQCQSCYRNFFATGSEFEIYDIAVDKEADREEHQLLPAGVLSDISLVLRRVGLRQRNNDRQKAFWKRLSPEQKQRLNERNKGYKAAMPPELRHKRYLIYHARWAEKVGPDRVRQTRDAAEERMKAKLSHEDYRALRNKYSQATLDNKVGKPLDARERYLVKSLVDGAVSIGQAVEAMGLVRSTGYRIWADIKAKLSIETVEQLQGVWVDR